MSSGEPVPDEGPVSRAQLRKKNQLTLPEHVRDALHLSEGDEVEFAIQPDGDVTLRGMTAIPTEQRWFWTEDWQVGEREASAQLAVGDGETDYSADDFLAALDALAANA